MKAALLHHDNTWPHTNLCTCEALTKMGWTVLPHPVHSPNLAPSNYHLFGRLKDALCGCHFEDDNELKQSFCDVLQNQGREFYSTDTALTQC
jgi:histone-lysine N-methyltransferase SETMAR